ncbi:MAG: polysaccharide deacetylase family protein [Tannerellaceae bacterium]|jgi:hypothetical protein|nr:polysaccharide deacetylase family protein [Tannerellaceae bacterium]
MNEIVAYLIRFLAGDDCASRVAYTADASAFKLYDLVIVPSGFFDDGVYAADSSLPKLPLATWDEIPLLFGRPELRIDGRTTVLYADLIASSYFLLSRYEEMMRPGVRDAHGRFPGRESLPYRAGFMHRPILDEYRRALRKLLGKDDCQAGFSGIEITHDIDAPYLYRSPKGFVRSLLDGRGLSRSISGLYGPPDLDPYYTFPRMQAMSRILSGNVSYRLFFRAGGRSSFDKPHYDPASNDIRRIAELFAANDDFEAGLHASYDAGRNPSLLEKEKNGLEKALGCPIVCNRHHFLAAREPKDMRWLIRAGIGHDYTMGYADTAGFRLGTARTARWIDPADRKLSDLLLHPLMIMDSSLEEKKYMGLTYEAALAHCRMLIDNAHGLGGTLSLLWHNTSFAEPNDTYLDRLYADTLYYISKKNI